MANKRDPRKVTEADVLKAVKHLLEAKGFRVFRRNTGAVRASYTSTRTGKTSERFVRFSEPGQSDLYGWATQKVKMGSISIPPGTHIEVEVKRPGEKPNAEQQTWLYLANCNHCFAFWCDS